MSAKPARSTGARYLAPIALSAWATLLIGLLTLPLLAPGIPALRDMMVLDHPALSPGALGWGDLPARGAPQDGVLALIGQVLPASWAMRGFVVGASIAGAWGSFLLARHVGAGPWGSAAALTIGLANPAVIERLLQGQWSLVMAAWLLPLIAWAGLSERPRAQWVAMWGASLSPTGGLFALLMGFFTARRQRWATALVGLVLCAPWWVPGLLAGADTTSSTRAVAAFAPRTEAFAGTPGTLLGLGGIWNAAAVPGSREAGWALAGVVLFALLCTAWRACPRPLLWLGGLGLALACAAWALPSVLGMAVGNFPGGGLLRDAHKFTLLAVPAYVALAGALRPGRAAGALALAAVQLIDAPLSLSALRPLPPEALPVPPTTMEAVQKEAAGREVLVVGSYSESLIPVEGRPLVNPWWKALGAVEPGNLTVDGVEVDPPNPRWVAAQGAWRAGDLPELERLGVGLVVDGGTGEVLAATQAPAPDTSRGLWLLGAWALVVPVAVLLLRPRAKAARKPRPTASARSGRQPPARKRPSPAARRRYPGGGAGGRR
ncbi:hypothetical protein Clow_01420 [Corynebacterium lowii]|uniref:Uncharacterized protein n=1 Tax=Corynebacterium lowii TaxID=1544413 RepID=A0A0Q1E0S0_9CORY|nr:hypothetical protein Clow_01420 [Corynebacterium lowii]MDP9852540.1 hypothetical protein [Corynebacterium lowii]